MNQRGTWKNHNNLFAGRSAVCHCIVNADFTKVAAVDAVVSETTIDQPRLVKVRMSGVDVRQLYCHQILYLSRTHSEQQATFSITYIYQGHNS